LVVAKLKSAGSEIVTVDRRRGERREKVTNNAVETKLPAERREKKNRRRQIDPTTCERDYNADEVEFMQALDAYKRTSGRMFPTCSEILEVIRGLGYVRPQTPAPEGEATENVTLESAVR
jgi:hypothetical protein